jgi:hypothetical protein
MVVEFPLLQIWGLQRCTGAKVGGDLLAPKAINISQPTVRVLVDSTCLVETTYREVGSRSPVLFHRTSFVPAIAGHENPAFADLWNFLSARGRERCQLIYRDGLETITIATLLFGLIHRQVGLLD